MPARVVCVGDFCTVSIVAERGKETRSLPCPNERIGYGTPPRSNRKPALRTPSTSVSSHGTGCPIPNADIRGGRPDPPALSPQSRHGSRVRFGGGGSGGDRSSPLCVCEKQPSPHVFSLSRLARSLMVSDTTLRSLVPAYLGLASLKMGSRDSLCSTILASRGVRQLMRTFPTDTSSWICRGKGHVQPPGVDRSSHDVDVDSGVMGIR